MNLWSNYQTFFSKPLYLSAKTNREEDEELMTATDKLKFLWISQKGIEVADSKGPR